MVLLKLFHNFSKTQYLKSFRLAEVSVTEKDNNFTEQKQPKHGNWSCRKTQDYALFKN